MPRSREREIKERMRVRVRGEKKRDEKQSARVLTHTLLVF